MVDATTELATAPSTFNQQPSISHQPISHRASQQGTVIPRGGCYYRTGHCSNNQHPISNQSISNQSAISHLRTWIVAACRLAPPPGGMLRRSTAVEHIHQQALFHNSVQQSCSGPRSPLPWPSFNHVFNRRSDLIVLFLGPYVWHPFSSFSWLFSTCSAVTTCSASLLYVSTILGAPFCARCSSAELPSNISPL